MNLARAAVHRPIFTTMVTLIVLIMGGVSLYRIPVDLMPDVTSPTLSVSTRYENASPAEIEELITRPVEEAMSAVPGVEEVSSVSSEGNSNVRITFAWGTDLDAAANDIRDRLDRVIPRLPEEADRPTLRKFDLASFPILILGAASRLDPVQMRKLIDDQVKYRIERVPGVAALDVMGGQEREIHVLLDPDKIKALGIPLDVLVSRIKDANVTLPAGTLEAGNYEMVVRTPGEYTNLDQLRETAVAVRQGVPVLLKDVAQIEDSWLKVTRLVRVNGVPGVRMSVNKQSGRNTVDVARAVREEIERINQDIPQVRITPIVDTSEYIERSITNVGSSAMYGGLYAIVILLLFLRNVRSTAIIATAIPISIIATFMLIYFGGFTMNLMTLGGLALGVGMLVDNAIVVLENIYRLREGDRQLGGEEAAVRGTEEVTAAIVSSTLTTVVVFLPLIFVRGMAGVMFKQLAYVVSFALLCSLAVALTLVPMLASRFLRPVSLDATADETVTHKLFRITGRFLEGIERRYKDALHTSLNHRLWVVAAALLLLVSSLALIPLIGTELMPTADEGQVRINVEMEVGTKLSLLDETFRPIEAIVAREVPEARSTVTSMGGSGWHSGGSHKGDMSVNLKPLSERTRSSDEIAAALRQKLAGIPGTTIRTRAGQGLFILRMASGRADQLQVEVRGYDLQIADALARRVKEVVETVPGVTDATISRDSGQPERLVVVDRTKAEAMKVSVSQAASMLQTVLGGTRASYYREGGDEYAILVKLKDSEKQSLQSILDLTLTSATGEPVVLRNIVNVQERTGPVGIERNDQERIVLIEANVLGRDMGSIVADVRERLRSIPIPRDFSVGFGGDYEEQQKAFRELGLGLVLSLILVYMVMACQYESLRDPLVVMFSVPLAIIGVTVTLFLTHTTFNVQSYIGCIMLGGIVVNNAILLVDHTNLLRRRDGLGAREAIEEAGRRRLRPILMTTLTTVLGLIPLALGLGEGGEAQAPLARAVIGGLTSSTLLTLVFVPVVYSLFEEGWRKKRKVSP
jgi:HAE1 family hydrophobic/amphiphilic exporter-1